MNSKTSGIIIALSSAVAGSLTPSAAAAYLAENYVIATGILTIVVLNACIAMLHIKDRSDVVAVHDSSEKPVPQKKPAAPRPLQHPVEMMDPAPSGPSVRRVRSPPVAVQSESPSSAQSV